MSVYYYSRSLHGYCHYCRFPERVIIHTKRGNKYFYSFNMTDSIEVYNKYLLLNV